MFPLKSIKLAAAVAAFSLLAASAQAAVVITVTSLGAAGTNITVTGSLPSLVAGSNLNSAANAGYFSTLSLGKDGRYGFLSGGGIQGVAAGTTYNQYYGANQGGAFQGSATMATEPVVTGSLIGVPANFELTLPGSETIVLGMVTVFQPGSPGFPPFFFPMPPTTTYALQVEQTNATAGYVWDENITIPTDISSWATVSSSRTESWVSNVASGSIADSITINIVAAGVPEPSAALLGLIGGAAALRRRRAGAR